MQKPHVAQSRASRWTGLRPGPLTLALVLALALTGCGSKLTKKGDLHAKKGDWEKALVEYREIAKTNESNAVLDKVTRAEREVAAIYVKRGLEAKELKQWAVAGDFWGRALVLRPTDAKIKKVVADHAVALEQFADEAVAEKRYEDAFKGYAPLLLASPERVDLIGKSEKAHKRFASELDNQAIALNTKGLVGTALLVELRALRHDPLHPSAYQRSTEYRKTLLTKQTVAIDSVTMVDGGWWGMGNALLPRLTVRLGQYPPYGPTKNKNAIPATFTVTVEEFAWFDRIERGIESRPNTDVAKIENAKERVPNPERGAWQKLVVLLERDLKTMESGKAPEAVAASPWKTSADEAVPVADKKDDKKKDTKKDTKKDGKKEEPKKADKKSSSVTARAPTPEDIQKKREEWQNAVKKLEAMPETVDAATAAMSWTLPWAETTRTVLARVRFEIREPDFGEPLVITRTLTVEAKDRTHTGNTEHALPADALELPHVERQANDLADKFADGVDVIRDARARRALRLVEQGRTALAAGSEEQALDAWVASVFVSGVADLPTDAASLLVAKMENDRLKDIVAP